MPELKQPLYLYRQHERLCVRWQGELDIDGIKHSDWAMLPTQGCIRSPAFTFAVEALER
jgi:hypothetical protein